MDGTWTRKGGCRCGRVRLRVTAPPMLTMACHCTGCQRMTASAFSLSAAFPPDALEITAGEPEVGALRKSEHRHMYCGWCKTWLFTRIEGAPFVNVRTPALDDSSGLEPFIETQLAEKLPWATTPAAHGFDHWPPQDAFGPLIAEYAARRAAQQRSGMSDSTTRS